MSTRRIIKKQEDVELSEDGKTLEVLYEFDYNGNNYIDIPIEFVQQALPPQTDEWKEKLISLLRGLEAQNIDKFIEVAKTPNDYLQYGLAYSSAAMKLKNHPPQTECEHRWIHNTNNNTKYCSKGCDGFKEHPSRVG